MARIPKKGIIGIILIVIVVLVGGYFARSAMQGGASDAVADTTAADSTLAENDEKKDGEGEDEENKGPDPVPVEVATVSPREISSYYYTTATLDPEREVIVQAKAAGEINRLIVEEGDRVKAGQILCQLVDDEQRIAMEEARINKEQREAEFNRLKTMLDQNVVSDKEASDAKYAFEVARTQFQTAELRYEYTRIRAPFDGIVTKRMVDLGQNVAVGVELFEVVDADPLLIKMYLPENEVKDIRVGQAVTIHPDNDPDAVLDGRILRIAPEVDENTGTVKVTAQTTGGAMPGSFARIKIVTDTRVGSLAVPRRGLVSDAGEIFVFVAAADSVRKTEIQVGYQDDKYAEILEGVAEGDSVVVVGLGGLRTGTKVKVVDPALQDVLSKTEVEATTSN